MPITKDELTIVSSGDWCAQDGEPCYYDRNAALITGMRTPPVWVHDFPSLSSPIYRIGGKRVARWRLACSMTIDQAMTLWPFTGHPVALPAWHYDGVQADSGLCTCTTRSHRKAACIIGPGGRKCLICASCTGTTATSPTTAWAARTGWSAASCMSPTGPPRP